MKHSALTTVAVCCYTVLDTVLYFKSHRPQPCCFFCGFKNWFYTQISPNRMFLNSSSWTNRFIPSCSPWNFMSTRVVQHMRWIQKCLYYPNLKTTQIEQEIFWLKSKIQKVTTQLEVLKFLDNPTSTLNKISHQDNESSFRICSNIINLFVP